MLDNLRPPPRRELIEAWKKLMQSKLKRRMPLNSTQALQCRRLLEYLAKPDGENAKTLSSADLAMARQVLLDIKPRERTQNHLEFAKALYAVWSSGSFSGKAREPERYWSHVVQMLSEYGGSAEAAQMVKEKWNDPAYQAYAIKSKLVDVVARGLAREEKEQELVELAEFASVAEIPNDGLQEIMIKYFATRDRIPETKSWLDTPTDRLRCRAEAYRAVASFARRNQLQEWAVPIFLELGESQPRGKYWDVILQSILLLGKSLAEVETMMSHMVDRDGPLPPTIDTINCLLEVAAETKDISLADEILALSADKHIAPNGETYLVLLRLRLQTGDLTAAHGAFEQVRHYEPWANETKAGLYQEFARRTNEFLVRLSQQERPDFTAIMAILEAVEEEQMILNPETAGALCVRFLENDQHYDVMDILSVHSFTYSEQQREVVQSAFVAFCLDRNTTTSRAWGAYQLLQQFFQDTSFELRAKLMAAFFERKRPDMASHVFGHMRQHRNKSYHPRLETYIQYLEGAAQYPDAEGLTMIHNMLKMDTTVQPNTKLYTGLMLAYTACDKPLTALDFWNEITQSREGPSYASLEAVFWALERRSGGDKQAREIWERIERMDLEVPAAVYNAYVGAMAGNGNEKEVRSLIMNMASYVGAEPDSTT